jgi:hypothetical protein
MRRASLLVLIAALAPSCLLVTSLNGLEGPLLVEDAGQGTMEAEAGPGSDGGEASEVEADAGFVDLTDAGAPEADAPSDGPGAGDADAEGSFDAHDAGDAAPYGLILFQKTSGVPLGIAVGPTDVYWTETNQHGLLRAPKTATSPTSGVHVEKLADELGDPFDVAVDDAYIYWTEQGVTANTVWRRFLVPAPDAGAKESYFPGPGATEYLAVGPGHGYVTARSLHQIVGGPRGCCTSDQLYPLEYGVSGIALVGDVLYWSVPASAGSNLMAGAAAGGTSPSPVAMVEGAVTGVAADRKGIYWISDRRRVMGMNIVARQPQVLLYESAVDLGAGDIAIDDDRIYFTAPLLKAVFALPRKEL